MEALAEAPLDDYAREVILRAVAQACQGCRADVRFSCTRPGAEGFVDLLRAANCAGLAYLDNDLHLCLHPTFGPWIGLRAVVVLDAPAGPDVGRPLSDPIPAKLRMQLQAAMAEAMEEVHKQAEAREGVRSNWEVWAAMRRLAGSMFAPGAEYCPGQMAYHYTSDKGLLREAVRQAAEAGGPGA
ncbi:hypothetical protein HYH03_013165 [Edaphochlamys debaryana]|uniref:Cyanocobalamin reductase (cyanide-eliminating) n=1 Tax=Edaphochlamys debaryana TaxID=47281 RepID=A0A835XWU9_9CHLO|nr:hypothetical protein HYH03_013165 [Edaphochlamys debaryana]|eukprot:KAG2488315.1 hypothetical protein HYH03_013165 [Edaphochlamys debaryana]